MSLSSIRRFLGMSVDIDDFFTKAELDSVTERIREAEKLHMGELAVVIETEPIRRSGGVKMTPFQRAMECFGKYGVWDTEHNLGILIYVNLYEREIQIVSDRGLRDCFETSDLDEYCQVMVSCFRNGAFFKGLSEVMDRVNARIAQRHPRTVAKSLNEIADEVIVN